MSENPIPHPTLFTHFVDPYFVLSPNSHTCGDSFLLSFAPILKFDPQPTCLNKSRHFFARYIITPFSIAQTRYKIQIQAFFKPKEEGFLAIKMGPQRNRVCLSLRPFSQLKKIVPILWFIYNHSQRHIRLTIFT